MTLIALAMILIGVSIIGAMALAVSMAIIWRRLWREHRDRIAWIEARHDAMRAEVDAPLRPLGRRFKL